MLIAVFDARGVVQFQFLPQGQTVNQYVYKEVLQHLLRAVRTRMPEMWKNKSWILHHDNAQVQTALRIRQYLVKNNIPLLEEPSYSSDLAPFLFPKLKKVIKGTHFGDVKNIKRAVIIKLKAIPEETFQKSIDA